MNDFKLWNLVLYIDGALNQLREEKNGLSKINSVGTARWDMEKKHTAHQLHSIEQGKFQMDHRFQHEN